MFQPQRSIGCSGSSAISTAIQSVLSAHSSSSLLNDGIHQTQPDILKNSSNSQYQHLIIPSCLLGGTAFAYSHLFSRSSASATTLSGGTASTPIAALWMLLLALQYAILPKLSKTYIRKDASKVQTALTEEVAKSTLALSLFVVCSSTERIHTTLAEWNMIRSLTMAGLPAILYAVQGVLQYQSHQYLDSVTFNGLQQTKILSAALFCFLLLQKTQSIQQIIALLILFWSSLLFQAPVGTNKNDKTKSLASLSTNKTSTTLTTRFKLGIFPCVMASIVSGLAGALSQRGLQQQKRVAASSRYITDPFFYALEVSFYSAVTLLVMPYLGRLANRRQQPQQQKVTKNDKLVKPVLTLPFDKDAMWMLIPTVCKALGGILTVLVHQNSGTVSKGFALTFGLVLSACFESAFTGIAMTVSQIIATIMVVAASWLYQLA